MNKQDPKQDEKLVAEDPASAAEATDEASTEESTAPPQHDRFKETTDQIRETSEKLWESTRHAWSTATFKAGQYKQLVQKKVDLSALHKKISAAHHDLGKLIDDLHEEGKKNIMNLAEVRALLDRLAGYKEAAAALEEEIETVRASVPPQEGSKEPKE